MSQIRITRFCSFSESKSLEALGRLLLVEEAKLESSCSLLTPCSMQMILLQLTSISGSVSCSMMETSCQVAAHCSRRMMCSFNLRVMACCTKTAELASHSHADSLSLSFSLSLCLSLTHTHTHTHTRTRK